MNPPKLSKGGSFLSLSWVKLINSIAFKGLQSIKILLDVNFYISVIVLIAGSICNRKFIYMNPATFKNTH